MWSTFACAFFSGVSQRMHGWWMDHYHLLHIIITNFIVSLAQKQLLYPNIKYVTCLWFWKYLTILRGKKVSKLEYKHHTGLCLFWDLWSQKDELYGKCKCGKFKSYTFNDGLIVFNSCKYSLEHLKRSLVNVFRF